MDIIIKGRPSSDGKKIRHYLEWGRDKGQRNSTGIFTYAKPATQVEKNHNKEAIAILETKRSQLTLERQSISSGYIPQHKFKANFLDYYSEFVQKNRVANNRHLEGSLSQFKVFLKNDYLAPMDITENFCERFRRFLLDKFNGETPACYFARFKQVLRTATKEGYFRQNPALDVAAKSNKNYKRKEFLEAFEYVQFLNTPCLNSEIREAFIFCCYTGLRWCDVKPLNWQNIREDSIVFTINQEKSTREVRITLHAIAKAFLDKRRKLFKQEEPFGKVFKLPSADGALKALDTWCKTAGLKKHITWHCARLSFSILLQDAQVDTATVALLMGHASSKYVFDIYKRYRPKDQSAVIAKLPDALPMAW